MSVVSDVSNRESSLAQFLVQAGTSAASGAVSATPDQFAAELRNSLDDLPAETHRVVFKTTPSTGPDTLSFVTSPSRPADQSVPTVAASAVTETPAGEIPGFDPLRGPVISKDMWTEQLLTEDISSETLWNIQDPADFLRARLDRVRTPTDAKVVNDNDGGSTPINSSFLSSLEQAEQVRDRLRDLGIDVGEIEQLSVSGGPFAMDWGSEERRAYTINGMSVGLILEKYARNTAAYADKMILDQFQLA